MLPRRAERREGHGDEAESRQEPGAGGRLDLCLPGLLSFFEKHVRTEQDKHPSRYAGHQFRRKKVTQSSADDRSAAGEERKSEFSGSGLYYWTLGEGSDKR